MCIAPITIYNSNGSQQVACHKCWQCRERRINDWVGRNIAESKTSRASHSVTLTYRDSEHPSAHVLTYSDVQKWLKRLRTAGYPVRYFVVGEYGSKKARAHWHAMLYWKLQPPEGIRLHRNLTGVAQWGDDMERRPREGFTWWDRPSPEAVRYVCKYLLKGAGDMEMQGHMGLSKQPPLGHDYFNTMAFEYAKAHLAPQTLAYSFPDVTRRKQDGTREVVEFRMMGTTAQNFLDAYVDYWRLLHPREHMPASDLVEEFLDPGAWKDVSKKLLASWLTPTPEPRNYVKPGAQNMADFEVEMWKRGIDPDPMEKWNLEQLAKRQKAGEPVRTKPDGRGQREEPRPGGDPAPDLQHDDEGAQLWDTRPDDGGDNNVVQFRHKNAGPDPESGV